MPPVGGDLHEGGKNETPLVQARMRQHEAPGRALPAIIIEQIEIESSGGVAARRAGGRIGFRVPAA